MLPIASPNFGASHRAGGERHLHQFGDMGVAVGIQLLLPLQNITRQGACGQTRVVLQDRRPMPGPVEADTCRPAAGDARRWVMQEHAVVIVGGGPTGLCVQLDARECVMSQHIEGGARLLLDSAVVW